MSPPITESVVPQTNVYGYGSGATGPGSFPLVVPGDDQIFAQESHELLSSPGQNFAQYNPIAETTTYTAANGDLVLADATAGSFTVTAPATTKGFLFTVKKVDVSVHTVTISPVSGTIDGSASLIISTQYQSNTLVCDGTNWWNV